MRKMHEANSCKAAVRCSKAEAVLPTAPTRVTAGPVVTALRTSPRGLGVRLSTMHYFVRYHTGKCHAIDLGPARSYLKISRAHKKRQC